MTDEKVLGDPNDDDDDDAPVIGAEIPTDEEEPADKLPPIDFWPQAGAENLPDEVPDGDPSKDD